MIPIKTTKEIWTVTNRNNINKDYGIVEFEKDLNVRWVKVEDIIKYIDNQCYSEILIKLRYELSQSRDISVKKDVREHTNEA